MANKPEMVTVIIPRTSPKDDDVFISVNNETFLIKRDEEVTIPKYAYDVYRESERQKKANWATIDALERRKR